MAPPRRRFGTQARKLPFRLPPGVQVITPSVARGGTVGSPGARFRVSQPYVSPTFGLSSQIVSQNYDRPKSTLEVVARILSVGESLVAGYAKGFFEGLNSDDLPPWAFVKAVGSGFAEIPDGLGEGLTFEELIKESADPDSWFYKHARPIGLGMSIFFDPVNYLTFGATAGAKTAAKGLLQYSWKRTAEEAGNVMAKGLRHPLTGVKYGPTDNIDKVMMEIHQAAGRPMSLGDAMVQLRTFDRHGVTKDTLDKLGIPEEQLGRVRLRENPSMLRRIAPRGGRGTRFAGFEVPGTPQLGAWAAGKMRGKSSDYLSTAAHGKMAGTSGFVANFIPDAKLMTIVDDARRAMAMTDFRNAEANARYITEQITKVQAPEIARLPTARLRALGSMFGDAEVVDVPMATRAGVLKKGADLSDPVRAEVHKRALSAKNRVINTVKKQSWEDSDRLAKSLEDLWDRLTVITDDPVETVAQFMVRGQSRVIVRNFIDEVLQNPLYARVLREDDEIARLQDELGKVDITQTGKVKKLEKQLEEAGASKTGLSVASLEEYGRIVGQNAVPITWHGKKYAVSEPIASAIDNLRNPSYIDAELSNFFRAANFLQNKWKIFATVVNPSFHVMNMLGGMWNNMLGGVYSPIDYARSWATVYQSRAEAAAKQGRRTPVFSDIIEGMGHSRADSAKLIENFEKHGAGGRASFLSAELSRGLGRELAESVGKRPAKRRAFTAGRRTLGALGAAEVGSDVLAGLGVEEADIDIPYTQGWMAAFMIPDLIKPGHYAASWVEEVLRLAPFEKTYRDRTLRQALDAYGPVIPAGLKPNLPSLGKRESDAMFNIGTELATHFQFDYSNLTHIERMWAKSFFPFYTYYKNNFVLQAKELVNRPRFINIAQQTASFLEDQWGQDISPEFEEMLPEYFSNLAAFQIPLPGFARDKLGIDAGEPVFLNPKLPFVSLNLFPAFWNLANDDAVTPTAQRWGALMAPIAGSIGPFAAFPVPGAKMIFEAWTNTNLGLNRPIDYQRASSNDYRQSFVPAPGWAKHMPAFMRDFFGMSQDPVTGQYEISATTSYILDSISTPFINNAGKALPVGGPGYQGEKARADMVSWLTGLRLMPVDPQRVERQWLYRMESMFEGERQRLRSQGRDLEPQDFQTLRIVRRQIKVAERYWDLREAELYGSANS